MITRHARRTADATAAPVRRVLLVEDEPLVTMTYQDALAGSEFAFVAILLCDKAVRWLSRNQPDLAIVDYVFDDGPCHPVVVRLRELRIPFLVVSSVGDPPDKDLLGAPTLSKPFRDRNLLRALRALPVEYAP